MPTVRRLKEHFCCPSKDYNRNTVTIWAKVLPFPDFFVGWFHLAGSFLSQTLIPFFVSGADGLVQKLAEKINVSSHKQLFAHLPLVTVCIEVSRFTPPVQNWNIWLCQHNVVFQCLGKIAEKYPALAKQSADCLRDFLTGPATIMTKMNRLANMEKPKNLPQVSSSQGVFCAKISGYIFVRSCSLKTTSLN